MGLLPFFKGDLSGVSIGHWGESACVFTLAAPTIDNPPEFERWRASYAGNVKIIQDGDTGPDAVTPLTVVQGPRSLSIERRLGDGTVASAQLELQLHDGPGAGSLTPDGHVEYLGSASGGLRVTFRHHVVVSS